MQITIGDLGAVTGVLVYRPSFSGSHFRGPHIVTIGYLLFAIASASALWARMASENKRRAEVLAGKRAPKEGEDADGEEERTKLGDRHVEWRYVI